MHNKFYINNAGYSKAELKAFANHELTNNLLIPDWQRALYEFITEWFSDSTAISIKTSGSTGTPKVITFTKEQMQLSAMRTLQYFNIQPHQTALLCLPVHYIAGMMMVVRAFTGNLKLITISPSQIELEGLPNIDFTAMVPHQMEQLIDKKQAIHVVKKVLLGGASLPSPIANKIIDNYKGQAWETYGMTETITQVAAREIKKGYNLNSFTALPQVKFELNSNHCLVINDTLIQDKPIETTDRVELTSQTSFKFIGRINNTINSGGVKIQPEEVEQLYSKYIEGRY